jgi:hypothetical protein
MARCCLQPDALRRFLVSRVKADLSVAALAELAKSRLLNVPIAEQNADTLGKLVAAKHKGTGCISAKS